jgi:subtilisin family serine protease
MNKRAFDELVGRHRWPAVDRRAIAIARLLALVPALAACGEEANPRREGQSVATTTSAATSASGARAQGTVVTLITGDRVTLRKGKNGRTMAVVEPGPGRDAITFSIKERKGQITVFPEDVKALVGSGHLDRALFNVTQLLADGLGDDVRDDLPLILTGASSASGMRSQLVATGVAIDRVMPSLGMLAMRQKKESAGAALASLVSAANATSSAGAAGGEGAGPVPKIWLDRRFQISLDQSVPQIGGPAAHSRGLSGAGVRVAVLDTGIDETHPDLAGKVALAESFLGDGQAHIDPSGHGTHVASTIAGSGAASGGQLRGVAPGATLLSGRVCSGAGRCPFSAILAGLEWAVANEAQIVNLSLGGLDDPEIDPLEEAINTLSAQHGTLFVVAAGNAGFEPGSVSSPSTADAALSVGAVDRLGARAPFSGQGPRVGDRAIKPDLTAPGVGIVAARAAGTQLGTPVGDFYARLNGTSMATPHVAGAAALLLQQHPDWAGDELKAALMGAAQPNEEESVYERGAGLVDLDRATRQTVSSAPGSLSLGVASSPHDDDEPMVRTVRYANRGGAPVTLTLAASLTARSGAAAPAGMIRVAPAALTIAAGGTAEAEVTVDTRVEAADDLYGGQLIATADGDRLVTPIGVERAGETFELTVSMLGSDGQPTEGDVTVLGLGPPGSPARDVQLYFMPVFGEATFRVPSGMYLLDGSHAFERTMLLAPRVSVSGDTSVVMDARLTRPVELTLPDPGYSIKFAAFDYSDFPNEQGSGTFGPHVFRTAELGASAAPGELVSNINVYMAPDSIPAAAVYHLGRGLRDHFSTGWKQTFRRADFAKVVAHHAGPPGHLLQRTTAAFPVLGGIIASHALPPQPAPFARTDYYYGADFEWHSEVSEQLPDPSSPTGFVDIASNDTIDTYLRGRSYQEGWHQAPFGPGFPVRTLFSASGNRVGAPQRFLGFLVLAPSLFSDQAVRTRNGSSALETGSLRLFRNGQLLDQVSYPRNLALFPRMPAERSTYRLEAEATRAPELFELSTEVRATWTFQAEGGSTDAILPLPTLRFYPVLDQLNRTAAEATLLPIRIERPLEAPTPAISDAQVEASFDDGATWRRIPLVRFRDQALGVVLHPRDATHVSLRASASDVAGNSVEQTIVRAYALSRQ